MRHQRIFYGKDNFHVDFQRHLMGIKRQWKRSESIALLVSLDASGFGTGQWSFLGPGSEKKWSSIIEDILQGEWDNVVEDDVDIRRKRIHATSPLRRGQFKSKDGGKLSIHCLPIWKHSKLFCRRLFLWNRSVLTSCCRNVWIVWNFMIERGNLLWWDNQVRHSCSVWLRQKFFWIARTQRIKIFYCNISENELKSITTR